MAKKIDTQTNKLPAIKPDPSVREMSDKPLDRINFILMVAAAVVIIIGFLLMLGPGSTTVEFNPDIFSTRRIAVGPTIAFLGFIFMGIAIIYRPTKTGENIKQKE